MMPPDETPGTSGTARTSSAKPVPAVRSGAVPVKTPDAPPSMPDTRPVEEQMSAEAVKKLTVALNAYVARDELFHENIRAMYDHYRLKEESGFELKQWTVLELLHNDLVKAWELACAGEKWKPIVPAKGAPRDPVFAARDARRS